MFSGLSAFPLTPADQDGVVDPDALCVLLERLVQARPTSIGLLGSTGGYAYLEPGQRQRAVAAAIECVAGRLPIIVGVGAMRTSWACQLAADAERAGADGLLLAPMSYVRLTPCEVARHYRAVAGATGLPICIYNNPGTTGFTFTPDLLAELAAVPNVAAVKMPPAARGDFGGELAALRTLTPTTFAIGYSGDPAASAALSAGADAFYSAIAGILPKPMVRLAEAAQGGRTAEVLSLEGAFAPLWELVRVHGGLRVSYMIADRLGLAVGQPPAPIDPIFSDIAEVEAALAALELL